MSWPRLLPTGNPDVINREAVAYYNYLIDGLMASGIQPMVRLPTNQVDYVSITTIASMHIVFN